MEQSTNEQKCIDLLNRQPFIDRLKYIADLLSKGKKNACYAINGEWGSGKSFVLAVRIAVCQQVAFGVVPNIALAFFAGTYYYFAKGLGNIELMSQKLCFVERVGTCKQRGISRNSPCAKPIIG